MSDMDGYADHLRSRRDTAAAQTELPPIGDVLAAARSREAAGAAGGSDGRSARWAMMVAAVVVIALIGGVVVALTRNSPVTVETAAPDGAQHPDSGPTGSSSGAGDALDGMALLFPPGDIDQMQARVSGDPEVPESRLTVDVAAEALVSGEVGEAPRVVSVVSAPPSAIDDVLDVLMLRRVVGLISDDGPVDTEYIRDQVIEELLPPDGRDVEGRSVEVREIPTESTPHTGPVVEIWIRITAGSPMDARIVRIPGEASTTFVFGSNVDRQTIDRVVGGLVEEGGLLRVGDLPNGFERLGRRSVRSLLGWGYSTIAPPGSGQRGSTQLHADRQETAGLSIVMMTRSIVLPGTSVVLRSGPDWVIGAVDPSIVMGVRDGLWVAVGDFMVRGPEDGVDAGDRWPSATTDRLLQLWDDMQSVDRSVFDAALARAADARADGGTDLFGDSNMDPGVGDGDTPVTTVVVGGPGD